VLFVVTTYVLIQLATCGVVLAFVVLEGDVLPSGWSQYLPTPKAKGQPYLNMAPALKVRRAVRAKEALQSSTCP
jgi:hypothetical protein